MYFEIRSRKTGKRLVGLGTFAKREEAKPDRDRLNNSFYNGDVPLHNREFYVARTQWHRKGESK